MLAHSVSGTYRCNGFDQDLQIDKETFALFLCLFLFVCLVLGVPISPQ